MVEMPVNSGFPAFVAQRIEHLTTDQKVGGSSPSKRTPFLFDSLTGHSGPEHSFCRKGSLGKDVRDLDSRCRCLSVKTDTRLDGGSMLTRYSYRC